MDSMMNLMMNLMMDSMTKLMMVNDRQASNLASSQDNSVNNRTLVCSDNPCDQW